MLKQAFGKLKSTTGKSIVLGISGSTCAGKTTLADGLRQKFIDVGISADVIHQDVFYKEKEEVSTLTCKDNSSILFYHYDQINSLKYDEMLKAVLEAKELNDVVIIEGNMITNIESIFKEIDAIILLTIDEEICEERRRKRVYDPPDEKGYFTQVVWPAWEETLNKVKIELKTSNKPKAFKSANTFISLDEIVIEFIHLICDKLELINSPIDVNISTKWVNSPNCGATSIFIGTTRDTFEEKIVKQLEYEAYNDMAYLEMSKLCKEVRRNYSTIERICICHRLGQVPVGEISVFIATSSPQRKEAIKATEWLINSLKERVPIWKKEMYNDGSSSWKENKEQPFLKPNQNGIVSNILNLDDQMQIPTKLELYEVKQAEWTPPEDVADLFWRRIIYNSAILSMRRIFREEYEAFPVGFNTIKIKKEAAEELDRLIAENEQRNKDLADARIKREKEIMEKLEEETLLEIERRLDRETEQADIKTKKVLSVIEASKNFVTKENLDEKIINALENPVNFDYAIDLNGQKLENVQPQKYFEGIKTFQRGRAFDHQPGYTLRKLDSIVRPKRKEDVKNNR
ncbi:hypothetical protein Mgra_00001030 [Meloidogyne graminicola]|uniref:Molybdopterin synthase catalytic subunit n=1 Tax=Meloidogyne graminicola TaxID=189291 RepID=A0A8T0A1G8_9BILA|nr:hypothetical protein Mgra_00001030 [Meloidogyne graminicola]